MSNTWKMLSGLSLLLLGCDPAPQSPATGLGRLAMLPPTATPAADTSSQYLYDFMRDALADQHLTRTQAIDPTPGEHIYASESDTVFLAALRNDLRKPDSAAESLSGLPFIGLLAALPSGLTKADVAAMLRQKQRFASFRWRRRRLGLGAVKGESVYQFSGPLFSEDKTKALLAIQDFCPGLCGTGKTVLFVKEQGRWKSKARSLPWFY